MSQRDETLERLQGAETGLAFVFALLVASLFFGNAFSKAALALALLCLLWNRPFQFLGRLWFRLGHGMGTVMSAVLLSLVYFFVICPMGLLFRLAKGNPLFLSPASDSLLVDREDDFVAADFDNTF